MCCAPCRGQASLARATHQTNGVCAASVLPRRAHLPDHAHTSAALHLLTTRPRPAALAWPPLVGLRRPPEPGRRARETVRAGLAGPTGLAGLSCSRHERMFQTVGISPPLWPTPRPCPATGAAQAKTPVARRVRDASPKGRDRHPHPSTRPPPGVKAGSTPRAPQPDPGLPGARPTAPAPSKSPSHRYPPPPHLTSTGERLACLPAPPPTRPTYPPHP